MGLSRALVDRARRVYTVEDPAQPWREGQPEAERRVGEWFAVRFRPESETDRGNSRAEGTARLLIGLRYIDATPLVDEATGRFVGFDIDDVLEIESPEAGSGLWEVAATAKPLRRRVSLLGFRCDLRRSREAEVEEGPITTGARSGAAAAALDGLDRVSAEGVPVEPVLSETPTRADLSELG